MQHSKESTNKKPTKRIRRYKTWPTARMAIQKLLNDGYIPTNITEIKNSYETAIKFTAHDKRGNSKTPNEIIIPVELINNLNGYIYENGLKHPAFM